MAAQFQYEMMGLDFETYAAVDLTVHGLARYLECPHFRPLLGGLAWTSDPYMQYSTESIDFVNGGLKDSTDLLREKLSRTKYVVAHNAPFEQGVLAKLGINLPSDRFLDSAVVARAAGGAGKLEAAAPQLLDSDKLELGKHLIRLFSIPGKYQAESGSDAFDPQVVEDNLALWGEFMFYCETDAKLGLRLAELTPAWLSSYEHKFAAITMDMNNAGWRVDMDLVLKMQRRYQDNQEQALWDFRRRELAHDLNLNSLKQLKEWCLARGIKAVSFDEKNVARMIDRITAKLEGNTPLDFVVANGYESVLRMLRTKQILGGSSLKKLQTIIDTAVETPDGWLLKDQYIHAGAGQSLRTTGRSTQMQNLKRLGENPDDMAELEDPDIEWDNTKLGQNMRQVFTARHQDGMLIVIDLKSVESCGLAWFANEEWKLQAYRDGKDVYKMLASQMYGVPYDLATAAQRTLGKTGELSCGYQAGASAVQSFSETMGAPLTSEEALALVTDWRITNPKTVNFWWQLDEMLHDVVEGRATWRQLALQDGFTLFVETCATPASLVRQHPGAQSIRLRLMHGRGQVFMLRYFHGCYMRGRNVCYYKPSELKQGDLWRSNFRDPKTKEIKFFSVYGGKMAGILTQSLCREIFFRNLTDVARYCRSFKDQLTLVGQFHDEVVVDWKPGVLLESAAKRNLQHLMVQVPGMQSFPLGASVKSAYRYIK